VEDGHVGHTVGPRQLPRRLQPAGDPEVARHAQNPGLGDRTRRRSTARDS
jgi:hypothetical protein